MTEKRKPGRVGILSAVVDPLLFEGGRRVFQIANKVVEHFGGRYEKKQIVNNIRSRITFLTTRKGYRFIKNSLKQVQLVTVELVKDGGNAPIEGTLELDNTPPVNERVSTPETK